MASGASGIFFSLQLLAFSLCLCGCSRIHQVTLLHDGTVATYDATDFCGITLCESYTRE